MVQLDKMKTKYLVITFLAAFVLACGALDAQTASPYGFRGPTHDGIYPDTGLLDKWPANGPQLLWQDLEIGKGYSSAVAVGDRVYVTGMTEDGKQETFICFSKDGKKLYTAPYSAPFDKSYPETRTTPTICDGKAYVVSGSGEAVCLDCATGKVLWKVDLFKTFGSTTGNWGTSECPLVFDDKMICTPGGNKTAMVALNKDTGAVIWQTKSFNNPRAYISPILVEWKGKRQIIGSTQNHIFGVNPDNGQIEWSFTGWKGGSRWDNIAPNSPIFKDGKVFFCHGYDINAYQLQLNDTMTDAKVAWKNEVLDTHHGGYVLLDGVVYGSNWINNGSGKWCAVDWNTGKTIYEVEWPGGKGKGSIIAADGKLFCYDERRGYVGLVKPGPKFEVVSEFRITQGDGPFWPHMSIGDGVLYVRHGSALMAYKIK